MEQQMDKLLHDKKERQQIDRASASAIGFDVSF